MIVDAISMIEFITSLNLLRIGIDTFQCVMIQDIMLLCLIIFCLAHHGTLWNNDRHTATPPHRHVYTYPMSVEMKKVKIIYHYYSRYNILIINILNNDYFKPLISSAFGGFILVIIISLYILYILVVRKVLKVKM